MRLHSNTLLFMAFLCTYHVQIFSIFPFKQFFLNWKQKKIYPAQNINAVDKTNILEEQINELTVLMYLLKTEQGYEKTSKIIEQGTKIINTANNMRRLTTEQTKQITFIQQIIREQKNKDE